MRKIKDVPRVLGPSGSYEGVKPASKPASQDPGEGMGRGKSSPRIGGDFGLESSSTRSEAKSLGGFREATLHVVKRKLGGRIEPFRF